MSSIRSLLASFLSGCAQEEAWADVEEYSSNGILCRLSAQVITRGRPVEARYKLSWWDCLIVAAAQLQGCCNRLYTEDLQHGAMFDGRAGEQSVRHAGAGRAGTVRECS